MNEPLRLRVPATRLRLFVARILYRALHPFTGSAPRIIERDEVRYRVNLSEALDFALFLTGRFQGYVLRPWTAVLPPDAVCLDVGANIGTMTLGLAKAFPHGHVYAFEPTFYALAKLEDNLSLNPELKARVDVVQSFVSDQGGPDHGLKAYSSWRLDGWKADNHRIHGGTPMPAEGVPALRLDDFVFGRSLPRIDLIKTDTDGHELAVLRGARRLLEEFKPYVIFELGLYLVKERGWRLDDYFDALVPLGYRFFNLKNGHQVTQENASREIPVYFTTDIAAIPPGRAVPPF